jgi:hypothetical protein
VSAEVGADCAISIAEADPSGPVREARQDAAVSGSAIQRTAAVVGMEGPSVHDLRREAGRLGQAATHEAGPVSRETGPTPGQS